MRIPSLCAVAGAASMFPAGCAWGMQANSTRAVVWGQVAVAAFVDADARRLGAVVSAGLAAIDAAFTGDRAGGDHLAMAARAGALHGVDGPTAGGGVGCRRSGGH